MRMGSAAVVPADMCGPRTPPPPGPGGAFVCGVDRGPGCGPRRSMMPEPPVCPFAAAGVGRFQGSGGPVPSTRPPPPHPPTPPHRLWGPGGSSGRTAQGPAPGPHPQPPPPPPGDRRGRFEQFDRGIVCGPSWSPLFCLKRPNFRAFFGLTPTEAFCPRARPDMPLPCRREFRSR